MADPTKKFDKGKENADTAGPGETGKTQAGAGSAPPRSMGTHGTEFGQMSDYDRSGQQGQSGTGQADLGSQSATTLAGRADQQDFDTDQPGRVAGAGEGFILQPDGGTGDDQQHQSASSAKATGGTDFAPQGRGAAEGEDQETGEGHPS